MLTIASAKLGDIVQGVWFAAYARFVEYGTRGRPGRRFVGSTAAEWQKIVDRNAERAKAAFK